ncbi:MAG: ABC transporter permease, partial [Crocinitomicaceae bacterium]|nr:ABC transporter permease [Crocinitomicaceae bacterium]
KVRHIYSKLVEDKAKFWIDKNKKENTRENTGAESPSVKRVGKTNPLLQYKWLTQRYFNIKLNDSVSTAITLGQAPIIAGLVCLIFGTVEQSVPFLMAICAIWFGASNASREIVSEQSIYKRERMFNQGILPYVFSKITVLGTFAAIQSLLFTVIISLNFSVDSSTEVAWNNPGMTFVWMLFMSLAATMMGLLLSAIAGSAEKVMALVPLALLPQIMLAGVVAGIDNKIVEWLSYLTLSRWGTEGLSVIQDRVAMEVTIPEVVEGTGVLDESLSPPELIEPEFHDVVKDTIVNATDALNENFHESYSRFGDWQNTLELDAIALGAITLIFFVGIIIALKKKDPIKIK